MQETRFWALIDEARNTASNQDEMTEILVDALIELPTKDIVEFEGILAKYLRLTHRYDIWAVAYIIQHGCSDDGFMDFRGWIISQGRKFVEEALASPQSIGKHINHSQVVRFESFLYVAIDAYERKTGDEIPDDFVPFCDNVPSAIGERWIPEQLPSTYPDLCEKFGYRPKDGM